MKISQIYIDGFGVWRDRRWTGLSAGMNVFHGPNEAGKTTLMGFIRSVLFGFERRSHPRRYEPVNGGDFGGWIDVVGEDGAFRVERRGGRHVRGTVEIRTASGEVVGAGSGGEPGRSDSEHVLEQLLGGTTRTLYHNVFAFGLEELEQFRTLEESEVASHISGAGLGVGAKRWSGVWNDLEERRSRLYLPRGQNSTLNRALREMESVREELDRTSGESEDYFRALESRDRVDGEIVELETEVRTLAGRIGHYRKLREAEPYRLRRAALEEELGTLEPVGCFPELGVQRLNFLFDQRREIDRELDSLRAETARLRAGRGDLARQYTPQDLIRRGLAVESLRLLLPRRDESGVGVASATARHEAALLEGHRIRATQAALRPPAVVSMIVLAGLIGAVTAGLSYSGYPWAPWAGSGLLVMLAVWYFQKKGSAGRLDGELALAGVRLRDAEVQLERAVSDGRDLAASIERLAGRSDLSPGELETEASRVRELGEIAERLRAADERLEQADRQDERLRKQSVDIEGKIRSLLDEGGASSETEFFRRSDLFRKRAELLAELDRTPSGLVDSPAEEAEGTIELLDEAAYPVVLARHESLVRRLEEARREAGRLDERLRSLSKSEERSRARLRQESVMARIDEASGKWAVLTLCRALLADTRQIYETERQPEVLRHASTFFSQMTGGRWTRVISPLDSGILVESATGERLSPDSLSRGTAEQLYLAMRLALVLEYSNHVTPLPVVLDDILVNFDPDRTRKSIEAIRELSRTHQVLLFTCHPHLVGIVQEILPSSELYPLQ